MIRTTFGYIAILLIALCVVLGLYPAEALEPKSYEEYAGDEVVGEAFGQPVNKQDFDYYYRTAQLFTRLGTQDEGRADEERRFEAWQNFIFLQEAKRLGITVSDAELRAELERLISERGIAYGTNDYKIWVVMQFNEQPEVFERRIEDLLIINKFIRLKNDPEVGVSEEEMEQKFRNQYSSFESEYILFDTRDQAEDFQAKVKKDPRLWKETFDQKKELGQKGASWINMMSLEALIDLWKIPKDDAYMVLGHEKGDFIVADNYYGDAVYRLLNKKAANMEDYDDKKKEQYRESIPNSKKRRMSKEYFDDLKERAAFRDYIAEAEFEAKKEGLREKSLIILETNSGEIELKLFPDSAPMACENFIGLVEKGYYDGMIFHRVIKDFMIQSGDPTGTGSGGESIWGQPFVDEIDDNLIFDHSGILAMANSGANTNKSQFFITVQATPWLNKKHTIFGEVVSGMDTVESIENTPTDDKDKPEEEQKIIKAYIKTD